MLPKILEFAPALAFFAAYKLSSDLIVATAVIIGTSAAAFVLQYLLFKKVSRMQIFVTAAVIAFGLPTVLLNDPGIIKWKITAVNLLLALLIFVTQMILKRNPFAYLFGQEIKLPLSAWQTLGQLWMIYFTAAAALNVVIAFYLPDIFGITAKEAEDWWVDYKTFGNAILNFIFALLCCLYLLRSNPEVFNDLREESKDKQR